MIKTPANREAPCEQRKPGQATILLVEDEADVRDVTRAVLEYAGYRVLAPDGPVEALRLMGEQRERIGLLLSDVVMPGMNGPDLALRLQTLLPGLVTVFMSGYADRDAIHRVMHSTMTSYIQKPFTIDVLLAGVAAALRTSSNTLQSERLAGLSSE